MANVYVDSNAAGAGTGADWTNAYTTLAAALAAKLAGDDFWVAHNHAESTAAAIALASPGTPASPCRIFCVNSAGTVPPVAADLRTTATVSTTGASTITKSGHAYCYGITFTAGDSTNNASIQYGGTVSMHWREEACKNVLGGSNASSQILIGSTTANITYAVEWINSTVKFANVAAGILPGGPFSLIWRDTASAIDATGSIPTNLFSGGSSARAAVIIVRNVDLSALGSGKTLVAANPGNYRISFERCKLDASVTKAATPTSLGAEVLFSNCDSAETNYKFEKYTYTGTETVETTIVRTGSEASDRTTPIAMKIITTANAKEAQPFASTPLIRWNNTEDSAITVNVYGTWGDAAVPDNNEIWMEIDYLGTAGSPIGSKATTARATLLTTVTAYSVDASTWGGSTSEFKMAATFTPVQKGPLTVRIFVGAASATFYIDPVPEISGQPTARAWAA